MQKIKQKCLCSSVILFVVFTVWTIIVKNVDVRTIGPNSSAVGLAQLNSFIHKLTGVQTALYTITDWLSIVPLGVVVGFGTLGLMQLIKRKKVRYVDYDLLILGGFYFVVFILYSLFEVCIINYRPILIEGVLEASYPSSTTMLVMCVMPTAIIQFNSRINNIILRRAVCIVSVIFTVFMVIGRGVSGVHWFTDIIGGILLGAGLVLLYYSLVLCKKQHLS